MFFVNCVMCLWMVLCMFLLKLWMVLCIFIEFGMMFLCMLFLMVLMVMMVGLWFRFSVWLMMVCRFSMICVDVMMGFMFS